jgi:LAO/AO transport system kinase
MLDMREKRIAHWTIPIYRTEANKGKGIEELVVGIRQHREMLNQEGFLRQRRKERIKTEFIEILRASLIKQILQKLSKNEELDQIVNKIANREIDPYSMAEKIIQEEL